MNETLKANVYLLGKHELLKHAIDTLFPIGGFFFFHHPWFHHDANWMMTGILGISLIFYIRKTTNLQLSFILGIIPFLIRYQH